MPLDFIGFPGIFLQFMYEVRKILSRYQERTTSKSMVCCANLFSTQLGLANRVTMLKLHS